MQYALTVLAAAAAVVNAVPHPRPQGVTDNISPSAAAPSGCTASFSGSFGIAVMNMTGGPGVAATQSADGQAEAGTATATPASQLPDGQPQASGAAPVTQLADGQPQAATITMAPVSQINDGQAQAPNVQMMTPVSQINDGQIQAPTAVTMMAASQISDGQAQAPTGTAVSQIGDGQAQAAAATGPAVSQLSDGQPQATTGSAVSQIGDGQPQATGASQASDGQAQASGSSGSSSGTTMVACASDSTLTLTLDDGVLTDNKGRTGYVAANNQFQFDAPAQTGAIYTSGFSVCGNGTLALGGTTEFYQCLSGTFFNLYFYDQGADVPEQCNPVSINVLELKQCS